MKLAMIEVTGRRGIAAMGADARLYGCLADAPDYPGDLDDLIARGEALDAVGERLLEMAALPLDGLAFAPPVSRPSKILCIGLNYVDHSIESGFTPPDYPTVFARFPSSLAAHGEPIPFPAASTEFDFEGEMAIVIGKACRNIGRSQALDHVIGYAVFNDISVRDYQFRTPQWTVGKNFDRTGSFGPYLVTARDVPAGGEGLLLTTRLNGEIVQQASTSDMIFDVPALVSILSEVMTLVPGDVIVTGTPSGVGMARVPKLFMKPGDECIVEIEQLGMLRNRIGLE